MPKPQPICDVFFRLSENVLKTTIPAQLAAQAKADNIQNICFCSGSGIDLEGQEARAFMESLSQELSVSWAPKLFAGSKINRIGELAEAGAAAFTVTSWDITLSDLKHAFEYAVTFERPVFTWPHGNPVDEGNILHESALSTKWGINGSPGLSEIIEILRMVELSKITGCRVHVHHLSTERAVKILADARGSNIPISGGVAPWNLIWNEENLMANPFNPEFRLDPPLRSLNDQKALLFGLREGFLFIEPSHMPMPKLEKMNPFELCAPGRESYGQLQNFIQKTLKVQIGAEYLGRALWSGPRDLVALEGKARPVRS